MIQFSEEEIMDICCVLVIVALSAFLGMAIYGAVKYITDAEATPGTEEARGETTNEAD
jgi:hypothetical protein